MLLGERSANLEVPEGWVEVQDRKYTPFCVYNAGTSLYQHLSTMGMREAYSELHRGCSGSCGYRRPQSLSPASGRVNVSEGPRGVDHDAD